MFLTSASMRTSIALQEEGLTVCSLAIHQAAAMVLTRPPPSPGQQERAWRSQGMDPLVDIRRRPVQVGRAPSDSTAHSKGYCIRAEWSKCIVGMSCRTLLVWTLGLRRWP
jgi:hypothetical protein